MKKNAVVSLYVCIGLKVKKSWGYSLNVNQMFPLSSYRPVSFLELGIQPIRFRGAGSSANHIISVSHSCFISDAKDR